jgi:hypothetical protein
MRHRGSSHRVEAPAERRRPVPVRVGHPSRREVYDVCVERRHPAHPPFVLAASMGMALGAGISSTSCVGQIGDPRSSVTSEEWVFPRPTQPPPLRPPPAGLRTLTPEQYEASVRSVLGLSATDRAAPVTRLGQWASSIAAATGGLSPQMVQRYESAAREVSEFMFADRARREGFVQCVPSAMAADPCVRSFVARVGRRAYRRRLHEDEAGRWTRLATSVANTPGHDIHDGLALVTSGVLQSVFFLYRVELGERDPSGRRPLRYSDEELATRLSYLLWADAPDEALLDAAERGELTQDASLDRQIDRMLGDPRARRGLESFVVDLLDMEALVTLEKDRVSFPTFERQRASMYDQLLLTSVDALDRQGIRGLFTTTTSFVDGPLAPLYGLEAEIPPSTAGLQRVEGIAHRAGILTTPGFLAIHAYPGKTSPAQRGLFVRRRFLCGDIPSPPVGVSTVLPERVGDRLVTTRELVRAHQTNPSCEACHALMDPIGLGLERFDAVGAYRERENDLPIDPSGTLDDAPFNDARGLGAVIAEHPALVPCVTARLLSVAAGFTVPASEPALRRMVDPRGDVRAILRAIVKSEAFRFAWPEAAGATVPNDAGAGGSLGTDASAGAGGSVGADASVTREAGR